ncbi:MAG: peptide ABC transporter substrate-binding protein [Candidatus Paceibacterota bacterium]
MITRKTRFSIIDKLLNLIEKQRASDRLVMRLLFFTIIIFGILFALSLNDKYSVIIPTSGGSLTEGIVGIPRFVNPALAITRADQDVTSLIYEGLLRIGQNGELEPALAKNVTVSENGLIYDIELRQDIFFHDGTPITVEDVVFTIDLIKNPDLKSPLRGNWTDTVIEPINDNELKIILKEPYSPFIENLTVGIMPSHVWGDLLIEQLPFSQYNTEPIGSGPFAITSISRDESGLIKTYTLKPNQYSDTKANLNEIKLRFFQNEKSLSSALQNNEITSTVYLPTSELAKLEPDKFQVISRPLPRIFGIFFNQNRSTALRDKAAREALNLTIDRQLIIAETLDGYGVPTLRPVLFKENTLESNDTDLTNSSSTLEQATEVLKAGGWNKNDSGVWEKEIDKSVETLSVTIKTSNSELFNKTANLIAKNWRELGVEVQVEQYEQAGLVQSVIRSRDFQALLFGVDMNRTQDLYPFWHSSQKDDPGLNVSQYTNVSVDDLLEKIRTTTDAFERQEIMLEVNDTITKEVPAIFLFAPEVNYVVSKDINIDMIDNLGKPSDRFTNIAKWHAKTETLWPIFHNNE